MTRTQFWTLLAAAVAEGRISADDAEAHKRQYDANPSAYGDLANNAATFDPYNTTGLNPDLPVGGPGPAPPPWPPTRPPTKPPTTTTPTGPDYLAGLSEADITAQYLAQLGIPAIGASPYQRWQARQALPTAASYIMQSQQNPKQAFADWLRQTGIMGARGALPGQYEQMMAAEPTGPTGPAGTRKSLGDLWNDMMEAVTGAKYGRFFGPTLAAAYPQMQAQYEVSPEGYGAPGEAGWLGWLRKRYGI